MNSPTKEIEVSVYAQWDDLNGGYRQPIAVITAGQIVFNVPVVDSADVRICLAAHDRQFPLEVRR